MTGHIASVHEGKKPLNCFVCDHSFSDKASLSWHIASVHEGKKPLKCYISDCNYSLKNIILQQFIRKGNHSIVLFVIYNFSQKVHLNQHIRLVHQDKKTHKCSNCDYSCSIKEKLDLTHPK